MKTLKIDEKQALKLYKNATQEFKQILEDSFGKEYFNQDIKSKIKTWEDVLEYNNVDDDDILPWGNPKNKKQRSQNALAKIQLISETLNEGWIPNFNNEKEYKYYPYFRKEKSSFVVYAGSRYSCLCAADVGFGCYFKSSELALYSANTFLDIYKDYLPE